MNNSKFAYDGSDVNEEVIDRTPYLRQREEELTKIIEAIQTIASSPTWKILEKHVFDGLEDSLNRRLRIEKDEKEMYRLQGQLVWAVKYADFKTLAEAYRNELKAVRTQLKPN